MCIALIGGMDRLERHYINEANRFDIQLKVFSKWEKNLSKKINSLDALIVFTDKVSHMARKEAKDVARNRQIPILMYHSSGIPTFRNCLDFIRNHKKGA
ncbi:MAG: DUF2325 domain-containing protein [Thermodesulfobacteriota bacterium]|nr:DUF2325 domain-containing protein [Thermodesulfobacteriota bacterium]